MFRNRVNNAKLYHGKGVKQYNNILSPLIPIILKAHKEVLRLRYDHYGACVSEHNLIRVTALLQANSQPDVILQEVNIPLSMPQLHVKVLGYSVCNCK